MRVLFVIMDTGMYISTFPQGVAYLTSVLLNEGIDVEIYNQDIHHWQDHKLTHYLDKEKFDLVGIGSIAGYYQFKRVIEISAAINASKNKPFFVLGGHGPSPEPEYYLEKTKADAVVIGEGENTIINLCDAIANHKNLKTVRGIAYRNNNGECIINEPNNLIEDVNSIPFPAYHKFPIDYYRLIKMPNSLKTDLTMRIISGRGCIFKCTFCYRMDKGFRPRSAESIVEEIELLQKNYGITYIGFTDELFMSSIERTIHLCETFINKGIEFRWSCNGRLNFAKQKVLLLMKKAGCVFVNYGIESLDQKVLNNMKKGLTVNQIVNGIEETLKAKISPGLNIIFGNLGDNAKTINKAVDFLIKYDDGAQMRTLKPVTPYPGSPLYYYAIEKGLLQDCADFYENKHNNSDLVTVNFTEMNDDEFHECLLNANKRLIKNYFQKQCDLSLQTAEKLYKDLNTHFRGFRVY